MDATSPHVQEPAVPGASGKYLDLGAFYRPIPPEEAEKMRRLFAAYRREYARAYDMLHAARLVSPGGIPGVLTAEAKARVRERAEAFAEKAVHRSETEYEKRRFLSAYTCRGAVLLSATAASFGRVYTLDNELGLADDFLQTVLERARSTGAARIVCPDPVDPEKLAALILPEDGLSLVAVSGNFRFDGKAARHFRLDTAAELSDAQRKEIRRAAALRRSLAAEACSALRRAKELHDELEAVYHPFVDFRALTRFEQKHLEKVFSA